MGRLRTEKAADFIAKSAALYVLLLERGNRAPFPQNRTVFSMGFVEAISLPLR